MGLSSTPGTRLLIGIGACVALVFPGAEAGARSRSILQKPALERPDALLRVYWQDVPSRFCQDVVAQWHVEGLADHRVQNTNNMYEAIRKGSNIEERAPQLKCL